MMKHTLLILLSIALAACGSSEKTIKLNDNNLSEFNNPSGKSYTFQYVIQLAAFKTELSAQNFIKDNKGKITHPLLMIFNEYKNLYLVQLPVFNSRSKAENILADLKSREVYKDVVMIIKKTEVNY